MVDFRHHGKKPGNFHCQGESSALAWCSVDCDGMCFGVFDENFGWVVLLEVGSGGERGE